MRRAPLRILFYTAMAGIKPLALNYSRAFRIVVSADSALGHEDDLRVRYVLDIDNAGHSLEVGGNRHHAPLPEGRQRNNAYNSTLSSQD